MNEGEGDGSFSGDMSFYNPTNNLQDSSFNSKTQNFNTSEQKLPKLNNSLGREVIERNHQKVLRENEDQDSTWAF